MKANSLQNWASFSLKCNPREKVWRWLPWQQKTAPNAPTFESFTTVIHLATKNLKRDQTFSKKSGGHFMSFWRGEKLSNNCNNRSAINYITMITFSDKPTSWNHWRVRGYSLRAWGIWWVSSFSLTLAISWRLISLMTLLWKENKRISHIT